MSQTPKRIIPYHLSSQLNLSEPVSSNLTMTTHQMNGDSPCLIATPTGRQHQFQPSCKSLINRIPCVPTNDPPTEPTHRAPPELLSQLSWKLIIPQVRISAGQDGDMQDLDDLIWGAVRRREQIMAMILWGHHPPPLQTPHKPS